MSTSAKAKATTAPAKPSTATATASIAQHPLVTREMVAALVVMTIAVTGVLIDVVLGGDPTLEAMSQHKHRDSTYHHLDMAGGSSMTVEASMPSTAFTASSNGRSEHKRRKMATPATPHAHSPEHLMMMEENIPMHDPGMTMEKEMRMDDEAHMEGAAAGANSGSSATGADEGGDAGSRMLIRRGQLDLRLDRPPIPRITADSPEEERRRMEDELQKEEAERATATMGAARRAVIGVFEGSGGYVESYSKQGGSSDHHHHHHHVQDDRLEFTARVPSDRFDSVMASLRELVLAPDDDRLAGSVLFESASTEDVTGQYIDAEARVRALRSSEKQLLVLMERAEAVKDILAVSRELSRVTAELEAQQSVAQRLASLSTLSTIHVSVQQPAASWQAPPPTPPRPQLSVWRQALKEVGQFWKWMGRLVVESGVVGILVVMPLGLLALALGWLGRAALRRAGVLIPAGLVPRGLGKWGSEEGAQPTEG